jgi:hypothetical protein
MKILIPWAILFILFLGFLASCYYDSEEYLFPQVNAQCDTTNFTYLNAVKPILQNYCLSCHGNSTAASLGGNIRLEDYADIKIRVDDHRLIGSIAREAGYSPMPMGASKLDDCKITTVKKWADSGAPNN